MTDGGVAAKSISVLLTRKQARYLSFEHSVSHINALTYLALMNPITAF